MAKRGGGCVRVVLLVILVPILLGLGTWFLSNLNRVVTHDSTQGVIVDLIWGTDSEGLPSATPIYEYQANGATYRYTSAVSLGGALVPSIGDTRTILYNPDNPSDARVRNMFLLLWLPLILMVVPILIAVGVFWGIRQRRKLADHAPPWNGPTTAEPDVWTASNPSPPDLDLGTANRTVIDATFMGTEPSQMDSRGNVRYRVKARVEMDDQIHRFRGEWMDEDPTLHYMQQGNKVQVRIDVDDPSVYEVLPPTTG